MNVWARAAVAVFVGEMILPTHPFWPLVPGSFIEYKAYLIKGYYHPDTMQIDINERVVDPNTPIFRRTCVLVPQRRSPTMAVVTSNSGHVPVLTDDWTGNVLYQMLWKPASGPAWLGEAGDDHVVEAGPPDPLITMNPVAGERIHTVDPVSVMIS